MCRGEAFNPNYHWKTEVLIFPLRCKNDKLFFPVLIFVFNPWMRSIFSFLDAFLLSVLILWVLTMCFLGNAVVWDMIGLILKKNKIVILVLGERYCNSCMSFQNNLFYWFSEWISEEDLISNGITTVDKNIVSLSNQWSSKTFTFMRLWILNISSQPVWCPQVDAGGLQVCCAWILWAFRIARGWGRRQLEAGGMSLCYPVGWTDSFQTASFSVQLHSEKDRRHW